MLHNRVHYALHKLQDVILLLAHKLRAAHPQKIVARWFSFPSLQKGLDASPGNSVSKRRRYCWLVPTTKVEVQVKIFLFTIERCSNLVGLMLPWQKHLGVFVKRLHFVPQHWLWQQCDQCILFSATNSNLKTHMAEKHREVFMKSIRVHPDRTVCVCDCLCVCVYDCCGNPWSALSLCRFQPDRDHIGFHGERDGHHCGKRFFIFMSRVCILRTFLLLDNFSISI